MNTIKKIWKALIKLVRNQIFKKMYSSCETNLTLLFFFFENQFEKLGWEKRWKNYVEHLVDKLCWWEKLGGKSVQCTVYSIQCRVYTVKYGSDPQFVEGAPVFLSLGSGTICTAPALPHPSRILKWAVVRDLEIE